ncbi:helix-turn-helix transcriptional regulator [Rhodobaculum claviforme]|uniref:helix-turn-helix transcriptional regulator n=1 Tax=Rhodobaculum claviforme TaxID=1549854 RepID=UPI001912ED95|nr:hypothetical protein [Rhodobaculum claviforme]
MAAFKYLTMNDIREALGGRSRGAIYKDIATGRLPQPLLLGGKNLWRSDELEAHLAHLTDAQRAEREARLEKDATAAARRDMRAARRARA